VVAPDLPGYNTSDKPPRVRDYRPRLLAQAVADLIMALGAGSATVAGHDWGGGLAWLLAMHDPERVQRLVILNTPHPVRFRKGLGSPRQLRRSRYLVAFQLPWLPERLLAARDFRALRRALGRQPTRPGAFTVQDIDRYVAAAAQPGALGAAINYYRAIFRANPLAQGTRYWRQP
jgi:epoxide hydrolase 4